MTEDNTLIVSESIEAQEDEQIARRLLRTFGILEQIENTLRSIKDESKADRLSKRKRNR